MSRLIFEARCRLAPPGRPQGHHRHRAAARAAPGDPAVVPAPGDALRAGDPDRRHDRRPVRHRDAADLAADAVLPVRAVAGRDRDVPRQRQQDAHRGGRRRTRRLPALPVGGPGQHPHPGRRPARRRAVVASRAQRTGHGARIAPPVGARPARPGLPGAARRPPPRAAGHHAAGQRHRRRDRSGTGVAQRITQPARHPSHGARRADRNRSGQGLPDHGAGFARRGARRDAGLDRSGGHLARPDGARDRPGDTRSGRPGLVLAEVVAAHRHSR